MTDNKPIISAKNLNFTYNKGRENEFQALVNISLNIFPQEYVIFFGPSGCGKSTLLNIFASLETPDSGNVQVFGKELTTMNGQEQAEYHRNRVGMIYQQYNLITSLTVLDNVALPQIFVNVKKRKREKWSKSLLDRMGILPQAHKIPTELSGGQQQRIGIARSIVNNPEIVLADEPVGNLDSVSAKNVLEILAELNEKEKKTIIVVTHNPENLVYGDRIIYMKDGIITREVVNKDKNIKDKKTDGPGGPEEMIPKTTVKEINDLMRAYHGLSPEQINILIMPYKAKAFAHHFISNRNMEETKILEDIIQRRLLGTIGKEDFTNKLNQRFTEGGVGFDIRTSGRIENRIESIISMAHYVYQEKHQAKDVGGEHTEIGDEEKSAGITKYLLNTCFKEHQKNLNETQLRRLTGSVHDRLIATVQKDGFFKFLDLPFKDGGVGLNSKTARSITEEMELILILGFGIVQRKNQEDYQTDKSIDTNLSGNIGSSEGVGLQSLSAKIAEQISQNIDSNSDGFDPGEKSDTNKKDDAEKAKVEVKKEENITK